MTTKKPFVIDILDIETDNPGEPHWLSPEGKLEATRHHISEKHRREWLKQQAEIAESFRTDNPGGRWLQGKRREAERSGQKVSGPLTTFSDELLKLRTDRIRNIPGAHGEQRIRGTSIKLKELERTIGDPSNFDTKRHPILIGVNHKGEGYILEGNHRIAYALKHKIPYVYAEIRYFAGGEEVKGKYHPSKIKAMLY